MAMSHDSNSLNLTANTANTLHSVQVETIKEEKELNI